MELRHLRYVTAVADERNFTRAAARLGIAQPPLSRQIRELEEELGVALFDRDHRPVRLTEAGRLFHEQAVRILAASEQLRATMRQIGPNHQRRFVIGVVGSIMHGALPEVIRRFRRATPVDCELIELTTLEQVAALRAGRIDAGLGRVRIDDPAIRRQILYDEPLIVALAADHPLATRDAPPSLIDIASERLIVYPSQPRPSYADQVLRLFGDKGIVPAQVVEVREVQAAIGLVAAQSGLAVVPEAMRHIQRRDIVYRPIADDGATSPVIFSVRSGDERPEVALLAGLARNVYSSNAHF